MVMCRDWLSCIIFDCVGLEEPELILLLSILMGVLGLSAFFALQLLQAPYGRYSAGAEKTSILFGCPVDGRWAWFMQEIPCVAWATIGIWNADPVQFQWQNKCMLGLFLLHYVNRAVIFPLRIASDKPTPLLVFLMAFMFCFLNGYMQARDITQYHRFEHDSEIRMWTGVTVFFIGMGINIDSDSILRNLRRGPQDAGKYYIPRGGMFDYVSGANFFGEIVEWTGFALASGSVPAAVFAFFTVCNIGPRAVQHHLDYKIKFSGRDGKELYPVERKALIPFLL